MEATPVKVRDMIGSETMSIPRELPPKGSTCMMLQPVTKSIDLFYDPPDDILPTGRWPPRILTPDRSVLRPGC